MRIGKLIASTRLVCTSIVMFCGGSLAGFGAETSLLLPLQSSARGSFVMAEDHLAYSWGYLLGYPVKMPRSFIPELYMPGFPAENLGTYQSIPFPHPIANEAKQWKAIFCNDWNALLLDQSGQAWFVPFAAASTNGQPLVVPVQITPPEGVDSWLAAAVANRQGCLISGTGNLYMLGPNWSNAVWHLPAATLPAPRFVSCDMRDYQGIALDEQGKLHGWGSNHQGMLGPLAGEGANQPVVLHASPDGLPWQKAVLGAEHAVGLSAGGRLFAWGSNSRGQLGVTNFYTSAVMECPMPTGVSAWLNAWAGGDFTLALGNDGSLYEWGSQNAWVHPPAPPEVRRYVAPDDSGGWQSVSVATYHRMAVTRSGRLFAWGSNWTGQLGQGRERAPEWENQYVPYPYYRSVADPDPVEVGLPGKSPANHQPSARLVSPLHGIQVAHTSVVQLVAQVFDPDGSTANVSFLIDSNLTVAAGLTENGLFAGEWTDVAQGEHLVQVVATDDTGTTNLLEAAWLEFLPTVSILPKHAHAKEPNLGVTGTNAIFVVTRTGSTAESLRVILSLSYRSTSSEGADFHPVGQYAEVQILKGADHVEVEVPIKSDRIVDPDEVITVYIRYARAVPGDPVYASVIIDDTPDDPARENQPPQVSVRTPGHLAVYEYGYEPQLLLWHSDTDGYVERIEWYEGTNLIAGGGDVPAASIDAWHSWAAPAPGTYQLHVVVQDNEGATTRSDDMQFTVLDPSVKGAGPNSLTLETIDPIAIRGTSDRAAVRIVRNGDAYPQFSVSHHLQSDPAPGDNYRMQPEFIHFMSGQVGGAFHVEAFAQDEASRRLRVRFETTSPAVQAVTNSNARVYLVSTNGFAAAGLSSNSPVVLEISRFSDDEILVEWFSNPNTSVARQLSLDLEHWVPTTRFDSPVGYRSFRAPIVTDLPALYFKAAP